MNKTFRDTDMQAVIGWILRLGVLLSMSIIFIGGIIYLYRHGHVTADYHTFKGVPDFVHNTRGILNGIITFRGRAIIQAGIILLIATPIIRVIFSAIGFILEKDYLYIGITVLVLLIIMASMLSGHAG
ncbi:DUF1634 domain-containing protein [Mucilaginibacter lappiensis]|uniref:Membrane protein n=1 Tax=Mucilaginibacter lappiensis TaxID=354630 RepID=A0A1N7CFH2_9SPHI|nr:DUF1634 domain-containing protein [Mucilaginibacter lappiensis]MBB6110842.1 putative membrane protein [Mucilaginibacter lappiensis]MBB6128113.1 putative membrane protein [Mucilaginibacter lappiensis]SIR62358.1 Uncharacterized membrane protein [Mucilaginibacter lappiensis]